MTIHDEDRLLASTSQERGDNALRPKLLAEFVGQGNGWRNLETFIHAALDRGDSMDHALLHGPPGLGKTTLAQIIAAELGVGFRATSGPVVARAGDLAALLTNLQPRDVLFIDEIHRLSPVVEEVLYPAMEDFKCDYIIGSGPSARVMQISIEKFTLIGATTRLGLLSRPLRDRFGIPLQLEFYTPENLKEIIILNAKKLNILIDESAAYEVAKRSRGTPRIAIRLLKRIVDFSVPFQISSIVFVSRSINNVGWKFF